MFSKIPAHYRAPLRSRSKVTNFLIDHCDHYSSHYGRSLFAFNVKLYRVDVDFARLIGRVKENSKEPFLSNPDWLKEAQALYEEIGIERIWETGLLSACEMVTESDAYSTLPDGTEVKAELGFLGRSGGWLVISNFEGYDFTRTDMSLNEWRECFGGKEDPMPYETLLKLYRYVVMCRHDFSIDQVEDTVLLNAADNFIYNLCADIPQYDSTQLGLALHD